MASVWPLLDRLRQCLCDQIVLDGLPQVCACSVLPGGPGLYDFAIGGQAWVRLVTAFPSTNFPAADTLSGCAAPLAYQVEVGIVRCAPQMDEQGNPPPVMEQTEAAIYQMGDLAAIRKAVQCCFAKDDYIYRLGSYTPIMLGDALGGAWTVYIGDN